MKKTVKIAIIAAAVLTVMFTGCRNPLDSSVLNDEITTAVAASGTVPEPAGEVTTGVKLTIPRYASWIGSVVPSRAYGFSDSIEVTVYDSGSAEVYNGSFSPSISGSITCEVVLSPGTGYTAVADIFNHVMSTTVPVVSGTSESFSISEGVVTQVPVICIPVNPISAESDTVYNFSGTATVIDGNGYPVSTGNEFWYSMTAPESGYLEVDVEVPQNIIFYYAGFNSAGEATYAFGDDVGGPGPGTLYFGSTPGEVYYFALICADSAASAISGSVSWSEIAVTALTDDDVPDPWLRACLEDELGGGKEFITGSNPEPSDPVTDMDLAMLTYLDAYISGNSEPVIISDLTGLGYCDNVTDLYLDDADLSGCDLSAGGTSAVALQGMSSLNWFRLCCTGLDSLDFISGLSGLSGLYVRDNPDLDASEFTVLTPANFPNLEYLYISGWDLDSDGDIDEDDYFAGDDWSDVMDILGRFSGLRSLEIREFWEGDEEFALLFNSGEVLDVNAGTLGSLFVSDNSLSDGSLTYIAGLSGLGHLNIDNNPAITSISALTVLTGLEHLDLSCTGVTDLSPLQTLYNAGAFQNHFDYDEIDITLNGCGLDLWEGTGNRAVIDYLIAGGVRVSYEYGNYLEEPVVENDWEYSGGYTVSGNIDFSSLTDREDVYYITLFLQDLYGSKSLNYTLSESDFSGYTADYSFINLEPDLQYDLYLQVRDSQDSYIAGKTEFFQSPESLTLDIILRDENDWGYDGGGTLSGTVDFSNLSFADNVDNISVQMQNTSNGDTISFSLSTDDVSENTVDYEIINLDPSVVYYQVLVSVCDNDSGQSAYTNESNLQVPTSGLVLDLEIREANDWGYDGGGTISGIFDFSGLSFASTVDSVYIRMYYNSGSLYAKDLYIWPADFSGYTAYYSFINTDPGRTDYGLYFCANSSSEGKSSLDSITGVQVPVEGLPYNVTATE